MNKKAQLVAMIAIVIAAVVFLVIVWPKLAVLLKGAGSQSTCNLNLFLAAAVKAGSLGFSEIPAGCEAEYLTIGKEEIDARKNIANKRIKKYVEDTTGHYRDALASFPTDSGNIPTRAALDEWALDSILGKEFVDCWNKVWHGKLDIFKRGFAADRTICIVCNVITFNEDLPASLRNRNAGNPIKSLNAWMNAEPYYQTTHYDFFAPGLTSKPAPNDFNFITSRPAAITYIEAKKSWFYKYGPVISPVIHAAAYGPSKTWAAMTFTSTDEDFKQLFIYPYDELNTYCTDVIA